MGAEGGGILAIPNKDIEWLELTITMGGMILLTIIFELIISAIEHATKGHAHVQQMVEKLFKELMILGFVSFAVLLTIELSAGTASSNPIFIAFELAHLWVFFIAVNLIINAVLAMFRVKKIKKHWERTASIPVEDLIDRYHKTDHSELKMPYWVYLLKGRGSLREEMGFHIIKKMFIRLHLLPDSFNFAGYLRHSLSDRITKHMDVKERTWGALIFYLMLKSVVVLSVDLSAANKAINTTKTNTTYNSSYGRMLGPAASDASSTAKVMGFVQHSALTMTLGWFLLFIEILVLMATRWSKDNLLREFGMCYRLEDLPKSLQKTHSTNFEKLADFLPDIHDTHGQEQSFQKVLPFGNRKIYTGLIEAILLFQCHCMSTIILFGAKAHFEYGAVIGFILLLIDLAPHFLMMFMMHPRVLKNDIWLNSICGSKRSLIDLVLYEQKLTHSIREKLACTLSAKYQRILHDNPNYKDLEDDPEKRKQSKILQLQAMKQMFDELAKKDHEHLTREEFRKALHSKFRFHLTTKEEISLWKSIDIDKSGTIDYMEFCKLVKSHDDGASLPISEDHISVGITKRSHTDHYRKDPSVDLHDVSMKQKTLSKMELKKLRKQGGTEGKTERLGKHRSVGSLELIGDGHAFGQVERLRFCFGSACVECKVCGMPVMITHLHAHSVDCIARKEAEEAEEKKTTETDADASKRNTGFSITSIFSARSKTVLGKSPKTKSRETKQGSNSDGKQKVEVVIHSKDESFIN